MGFRMLDMARKMRGGQLVALSFVVAALIACSGEVSVDKNYVDAFIEMRAMEAAYGTTSPVARMNRQEILRKYGFTRESYLKKTDEILEDEMTWVPFQKAVVARLDSMLSLNGINQNVPSTIKPANPPMPKKNVPQRRMRGED